MVELALSALRRIPRAGALLAAVAVAGCALTTPPARDAIVGDALPKGSVIPPAWQAEAATGAVADDWLKSFHDPTLDALVAEAIANNRDLAQAAESVRIAQQAVIVVGAQLLPQVGASLGGRVTRNEGQGGGYDTTLLYAGVAWELDVWGRLRAQRAAAEAGATATALDYAYARQSLAATVAKAWYLASEARQQLALAEQAVEVFEKLLALVTVRRAAGKVSDLDVVETTAALETVRGDVEVARAAYGEAQRALEVLLGRYPAAELAAASTFPVLPPPVAAGVPVSLLERRPDLAAAEQQVLAAFRQQEAAQLALLPDVSISLVGGRLGDQLLSVLGLNPWLASAALGVSVPIYEGGALRAKVQIATARQSQAVAAYGAAALNAFREVENALANEQLFAQRLPYQARAVESRTDAVRIATIQYVAGKQDLLWVSNLQAYQLSAESVLIKLRGQQRTNRIQLHLALGGSFDAVPAVSGGPAAMAGNP